MCLVSARLDSHSQEEHLLICGISSQEARILLKLFSLPFQLITGPGVMYE
jgi:hypothetical protein